jgi:hypothetical protein
MRFLADQDVYAVTVRLLNALGHDVVRIAELGLAQATDAELERVLTTYSEEQLRNAFVVIEPGRHRFRTLPGPRT